MSDEYGVTEDGVFEKKDIVEVREDLRDRFQRELEQDISLRPNSPIQQIIDATAIEMSRQWDAIEDTYFASFYEDSVGQQLDKQLALAGFSRQELRPATGEVTFSRATPAPRDIDIPEGTVVTTPRTETRPAIPFETTEAAVIFNGQSETAGVSIKAVAPWNTQIDEEFLGEETNVNPETITEFASAIAGVDSVTNPLATGKEGAERFQTGRDRETDAEFKLRYENSLAEGGVSTVPAMEASIFQFDERINAVRVDEVRDVSRGYGPEVTVFAPAIRDSTGGDDVIAQAVFESRAGGLDSFGEVTGEAESDTGRVYQESFNYADERVVAIDITLTTSELYPNDGDRRIKDLLVQFIGGVNSDDVLFPGLTIGQDVILDQVKKQVLQIAGVVEGDILIGDAGGTLSESNLSIGELDVATTALDEVSIDVV